MRIAIFDTLKVSVLLFLITSLLVSQALACLGDPATYIRSNHQIVSSTTHIMNGRGYKIVQVERDDGAIVKEYVNSAGVAFCVTWQSRNVPNLEPLLGAYFSEFQRAIRARGHQPGPLLLKTKNLVVESAGHLRAFHGRAYVPRLMPEQLTAAVLQ